MKSLKSIFIIVIMLFTVATGALLLLAIFNVIPSAETQQQIMKLAQACGVIAATALVLLGLSALSKK